MVRTKFKRSRAKGKATRKSKTVPDQSMSIKEIIRRFTRGIPVDVVQRPKVYIDQSDFDLEKMARQDFADKAFQASEMRAQNEQIERQMRANEQATKEREKEQAKAAQEASEQSERRHSKSLDNTMPDDTALTDRQLRGNKK